ncbi:4-hydroxyproline epimerase [Fimbriiglobus ruber]|uniref:4-hydroxyproline epimerase n=1 Tax=Fimbriiglobus ruber TaxID=1908690 RepID=A0A225DV83_9BACT|nr:4-hydroxyproline epimerase [Fimbriiglobus ruber]OWK41079.1 4-hydroxyproline epimerase [Fimbriiglobus ruber]
MQRVQVIDSHTAGEPTRVVVAGGPDLGPGSVADRCRVFAQRFDHFRSAVVNEPRGSDVLVGALLCEPADPVASAGVIFFNNVGTLGMCGHGTIGLVVTLAHLGRISPGDHVIETPVGNVTATLHPDGRVSVRNVPSYRFAKNVAVAAEGYGPVVGDVAWGGNWFFLVGEHRETIAIQNVERLTDVAWRVRQALNMNGITGAGGAVIDHVEFFGPPGDPANHSRNFVLCPGRAYDRSPCGTGTSAKLSCLAADDKLVPGQVWRQEGVLGTVFEGQYERGADGHVIPTVTGTAYITAEATLLFDERDPFAGGIRGL